MKPPEKTPNGSMERTGPKVARAGDIVGVTTFSYDVEMLDDYLESAVEFWRGDREPRGVEVEETWRCEYCEFSLNCEWREMKAGLKGEDLR